MTSHPQEYTDTDPRAMEVWLDLIRRMTPAERFARFLELNEMAEAFGRAGLRSAYPAATDRELFLRTAARHLPREWMIRVYGWDPESDAEPR